MGGEERGGDGREEEKRVRRGEERGQVKFCVTSKDKGTSW
jgi:hypothetical protein